MQQSLALIVSVAIEAAVAAVLVGRLGWGSGVRAAVVAALATLATHWLAWWCMLRLMEPLGYAIAFAGVEAAVVLAESMAYLVFVPLPVGRALLTSLAANAASAGLGLALHALGLA